MRKLVSAALCVAVIAAPVTAQENGQVVETPAPAAQTSDANVEAPSSEMLDDKFGVDALGGPVAGYAYFHRAGATLADQRADIDACRPVVLAMTHAAPAGVQSTNGYGATTYYYAPQSGPTMSAGAAAGAGVAAVIVVAAAVAAAQRAAELRGMQLNYENCMMVRGWSVMVLDNETGNSLDRLNESRLAERLGAMVGAAAPLGTVGRQFDNTQHFHTLAEVDEMSLSLRFLPDNYFAHELRSGNNMLNAASRREERERALRARARAEREAERERAVQAAYVGRPEGEAGSVDISTFAELSEGSALILVESGGPMLRFVRMNAQEGDGPDSIAPAQANTVSAFVVPAGDWRLVSLWTGAPATSNCLGAPVLRVGAGDVVFAGGFAANGAVDFALDNARGRLAAQPALAERLQAAAYTNGSTFECGAASFATAYEIGGAPFAEGYAWGSRAAASE